MRPEDLKGVRNGRYRLSELGHEKTLIVMTNHPLGDEIFAAYSAGALSAPMRMLVDAQAQVNQNVARHRGDSDRLAGVLLETIEPVALADGALDQALAVIDAEAAGAGEAGPLTRDARANAEGRKAANAAGEALNEILRLPDSVRDAALESAGWNFAGPGVRTMELMRDGSAKAELIRLEPGRDVPQHGHEGREFTLVLCGAFHDGRERYGAGDLCVADPEVHHRPVAEEGEVCIALAVTDGPLAFTGPLGWVQRALGGMN